jgi:hypothetical protein
MNFFYNKFEYGIKECIIKFVIKATSKKLSDGVNQQQQITSYVIANEGCGSNCIILC